ncbi:MAG: YeeE/YedE family protein [Polycyclovorans sp.]|nr:YeeE/YedE family protein [Polycyclovorans sp.]MBU0789323.1 YeeE/YedE family protein [Gammaproteobacteria bacterium]
MLVDVPAWIRGWVGGLLIGSSALLLMASQGKIAGISGVVGGLLAPAATGQRAWRLLFVAGLLVGALLVQWVTGRWVTTAIPASLGLMVVAGFVVGVGTRMGNGCTSGHGVCGLGRRSPRSLVAVMVFMSVAVATVFVSRHVLGG